jgi:hypothetical protein
MTKCLRKSTYREEDLFWITVAEVLVHGQLALLLWAHGEAEKHGNIKSVAGQGWLPPGGQKRKGEKEKKRNSCTILSRSNEKEYPSFLLYPSRETCSFSILNIM